MSAKILEARPIETEAGVRIALRLRGVGYWRDAPAKGALLAPGQPLGFLETLGVRTPLRVPEGAAGLVTEVLHAERALRPAEYGATLLLLDPEGMEGATAAMESAETEVRGLVLPAPMSGRFYLRPSPDEAPFVAPGDPVREGETLGLLEVMKTFHRVTYGGDGLPAEAKVRALLVEDGDDVGRGDALVAFEDD